MSLDQSKNTNGIGAAPTVFMQKSVKYKFTRYLIILLLLASIIAPIAITEVKITILLILTASLLAHYLFDRKIPIYKPFSIYSLMCVICGIFFVTHGLIRGHEGATSVITVMVIYPLLFLLMLPLYQKGDYRYLGNLFITLLIINLCIFIVFIFAKLQFLPPMVLTVFENIFGDGAMFGVHEGMPQFALPSIQSLFFLLPFTIFYTALGRHSINKKTWLSGLIIIAFILVFLTGRRGLVLMALLSSMIMAGIYFLWLKKKHAASRSGIIHKMVSAFFIFLLIGGSIHFVNYFEILRIDNVMANLITALDFRDNPSNLIRADQFVALIDGINDHPILGTGAGAVASYIRSEDTPWAYELAYVAFVFHYGIPAFVFYALGMIWLFVSLIVCARRVPPSQARFLIGVAAGFLCFIMANATNPYLTKFDFMWVIFLPAALVSFYNLNHEI